MKKLFLALCLCLPATAPLFAQEEEIVEIVDLEDEGEDGIVAPDFTLKDVKGNDVSLSEYLGSWVVLDFWGSWCRYCVQGIPDMKAIYAKYHDKGLEFIGIDYGDTPEQWRAAVERYALPWVNVYSAAQNPDQGVIGEYGIQGFPTKFVIDPSGYVYEIYVGEDPAFYKLLDDIFSNF